MTDRSLLDALCRALGIDTAYDDIWGVRHEAPESTLLAFLAAHGQAPADDADARARLQALEDAAWAAMLPPVLVLRPDAEGRVTVPVVLDADGSARLSWRLVLEDGRQRRGQCVVDTLAVVEHRAPAGPDVDAGGAGLRGMRVRRALTLDEVPLGYHELRVEAQAGSQAQAATRLIACPTRCFAPDDAAPGLRTWGPALQLYALRSAGNWGIGDFGDLARVVEVSAAAGAGLVGLNPLHALFPHDAEAASPYSPSSRSRLNPLYLDVEALPEYAECDAARALVESPAFRARLEALRARELVDYAGVSAAKHEVLGLLWQHFLSRHAGQGTAHARAFEGFRREAGEPLRRHALFEAIQAALHADDPTVWGWPAWPRPLRDPAGDAARAFERDEAERVGFFAWLQWHAERQLEAAAQRARALGMPIGLYRDLAVGVNSGGSDTWGRESLFALGARVGAPPDEFNPRGQDWGLPPWVPSALRAERYAPFVEALRANMRHAGALRIDHAMGLMRLFWVPPQAQPEHGTYVHYPLSDLAGIVALESVRQRCVIVGEDLGTVAPAMTQAMAEHAMLHYRPLWFERGHDGAFRAPQAVEPRALAAVSTHDLPTLRGFWRGADIEARHALDLFPGDEIRARTILGRSQDRAQLLLALERERLLPPGVTLDPLSLPEPEADFVAAVHAYLARTPSSLLVFQMEDAFGQLEQVNLPGTTEAVYPNWRRKLPVPLEQWEDDARLRALLAALVRERGMAPRVAHGASVEDAEAARAASGPRRDAIVPRATYRVQFHAGFRFEDAQRIVPYLAALGASHLYASPYLKARAGSTHGYDIIDHNALNPEIGDEAQYDAMTDALAAHGIGQLLDIVPNHMGVLGSDNGWWLDVLEHGRASRHAGYFDIDWEHVSTLLRGKVLVPVLGEQYGAVLERGELKPVLDAQAGTLSVQYWEHRFPIDPREYPAVLRDAVERLPATVGADAPEVSELASLVSAFGHLPARDETAPDKVAERARDAAIHKRRLAKLCARAPGVREAVDAAVAALADEPGRERLHALLEAQAFRLAHWRVASDDINYRRFFDINDLAALRMESEAVFEDAHRLVFRLLDEGRVQALRIDHPDGLYDPGAYFERLQRRAGGPGWSLAGEAAGKPLYLLIEKILAEDEPMPPAWPVHGETGYRFMNLVNGLFVDPAAQGRFDRIYAAFTGAAADYDEILYEAKKLIQATSLSSEFTVLSNTLHRIARSDRRTRDFTLNSLRAALSEVVAAFPVYRTYIVPGRVTELDRQHVDLAVQTAKRRNRNLDASLLDFVREVLLTRAADPVVADAPGAPPDAPQLRAFVGRFQQFTAPVTAKAMEDTSFYRFNRLVSLNEVGGDPRVFGLPPQAFHDAMLARARDWPHSMSGTSTHDTKRGEDLRVRIDVLSEMPARWRLMLRVWSRLNAAHKAVVDGVPAPSANDEYLLYQTLLGAWPFGEVDAQALSALRERIQAYMLKAAREAKRHTSWVNPNEAYEQALAGFIDGVLAGPEGNAFLDVFLPEQRIVERFGTYNALAQVLAKFTAPGVPDVYQGCELWNLSLVDPDNRRPVDYAQRERMLRVLEAEFPEDGVDRSDAVAALLAEPADGRIKMLLTRRLLALRSRDPDLFARGSYRPLDVQGERAEHVVAYARELEGRCVVVLLPRLLLKLAGGPQAGVIGAAWGDTHVALPGARAWRDSLTGKVHRLGAESTILAGTAFATAPFALLVPQEDG